ncbi:ABC transporter permease subunit [Aquipuribacter sp. MA13-6]|uniref:ABC transporter permease subunit n=1 Tax=unclassified Aquipuribacter TaxID=2635084 RepID=UPI003EEBAB47
MGPASHPAGAWLATASRLLTLTAVVAAVGVLPWLSGQDPALSILRARSAEQTPTPEALDAVRQRLDLADSPQGQLWRWAGDLARGDFGDSWVSGRPVLPGMLSALGVSLTLMACAALVALALATVLVVPSVRGALRGRPRRTGGAWAALLTALPEFLLAAGLLLVGAVWLRWFPPYGWGTVGQAVLPALALGVPAGGLTGRLLADAVSTCSTERWVATWTVAGFSRTRLALALLRRALAGLLPQVGLVLVALTGGAVAVERVFSVPGLGRATLGAAQAQDVPTLQLGVLLLLLLGVAFGVAATAGQRLLLGPALRAGVLSVPRAEFRRARLAWLVPLLAGGSLALLVAAGLGRDAYGADRGRLTPPSWALPLGADASGRDLLARLGQGAWTTIGTALLVCLACCLVGLLVGLAPRLSAGPVEVTNAAPPVIAGILVAAVAGPTAAGAAVAVLLVSWAPLAAHTAALVTEARAQPYVAILPVLGVGRLRVLLRHVLPTVVGPVARHAALRLPGVALALAALGFLGLGPQPPVPDWGLVLAEGMPYVERAPWVVLAPVLSLVALSVLAVSASTLAAPARRRVAAGGPAVSAVVPDPAAAGR